MIAEFETNGRTIARVFEKDGKFIAELFQPATKIKGWWITEHEFDNVDDAINKAQEWDWSNPLN